MNDLVSTLLRDLSGAPVATAPGHDDALEPVQEADLLRMAEAFGLTPERELLARQQSRRHAPGANGARSRTG